MPPSIIYLICGSTGAGKSTYAIQLSDKAGAVRFSIDEWMAALFWMDTPKPLDPSWAMERVNRCSWMSALRNRNRPADGRFLMARCLSAVRSTWPCAGAATRRVRMNHCWSILP